MIEQTPIRHKGSPPGLSAGGWLTAARACPSPNCDARPDEDDISLLVIHNISLPPGQFGGAYIDQLFTNTLDATAHPYFAQIHTLRVRSEEHTSELQSLMRISYAVFCLKKKKIHNHQ